MKNYKSILVVLGILIVVVASVRAYTATNNTNTKTNPSSLTSSISDTGSVMYSGGSYTDYEDTDIVSLSGNIVLFFHADRCPTCIAAEKSFMKTGIPQGLHIIKVDFDTMTELRKKYLITTQTSFVQIDPDGVMLTKWIGARDVDDVLEQLVGMQNNNIITGSDTINDSSKEQSQQAMERIDTNNAMEQTDTTITKAKTTTVKAAASTSAKAYLAGGCFWCIEGPFESLPGVSSVVNGYIGGSADTANYTTVSRGTTKHREAVEITYDPSKISYDALLKQYRRQIDPTDGGGQFADRGYQYTPAIFYSNSQEQAIATAAKSTLDTSGKFDKAVAVKILPAATFYPAENYHQDYYKKQSAAYKSYKKGSGREDYINNNWSDTSAQVTTETIAKPGVISRKDQKINNKAQLTPRQLNIIFKDGTEPAYDNQYWDNHQAGIYVDAVDGTPLFSSIDKYDSNTGRPSFVKPIASSAVSYETDNLLGVSRTEVISASSQGHLGHIFDDGPTDRGGKRYCMNSASMTFIPQSQLEAKGYGEYVGLFK